MRKADAVGAAGVVFLAGFAGFVWPPLVLAVLGAACLAYDVMH